MNTYQNLHTKWVDASDFRAAVHTPTLVVDLSIMEQNIFRMQSLANDYGVALRPHAKAHKCSDIATLQIQAGACGQCCATLGEAEALVAAGVSDILLTAPVTEHKIGRIAELAAKSPKFTIVVDRHSMVKALQEFLRDAGQTLNIVIDIDVGQQRSGVKDEAEVFALVQAVNTSSHLHFKGLQAYAGMLQGIRSFEERQQHALQVHDSLRKILQFLETKGHKIEYVTGAGTGTCLIDLQSGVFTEIQAGSYIFMDSQYGAVELDQRGKLKFPTALQLWTRIISANHKGFATTDGGLKSIPNDGINPPQVIAGAPNDTKYDYFGDEFGRLTTQDKEFQFSVGHLIETTVPHCDTAIATANTLLGVRENRLEQIFKLDLRGAW